MLSAEELEALSERCAARDAALIVDEVFADYPLEEGSPGSLDPRGPPPCLTFRLGGLSKSAALPQVKLGWIAVDGPAPLVDEALARLEFICDTYLSVSTPVQVAAAELIAGGADPRAQVIERVRANYSTLRRLCASCSTVDVLHADGGWSAVVRVAATASEEELTLDLLERDGVVVYPGFFFDFPREAFLIVSLLPDPRAFASGVRAGAGTGRWLTARFTAAGMPACSSRSSPFRRGRAGATGEIADLPILARWLETAGLDLVQLLPSNEMDEGQNSPYSALSAMAIDPVFIALRDVEEFADAGGEAALDPADRARLEEVRRRPAVDFRTVRALKRVAFHLAFHVFRDRRKGAGNVARRRFPGVRRPRALVARRLRALPALHDEHRGIYWRDWQPELRDRDPAALDRARRRLADTILFYQYLQWLADSQWQRARRDCGGVGIFGDFPFMVSGHSADVWSRQHQFRIDASVGVPPDAFSETGQDWGLPVYRWEAMRQDDYAWLRQRTRRCTDLYDGFRVDHLVGFYRTYVRERDGRTYFTPADEPSQARRASACSPSSASAAPASSPKTSASSPTSFGNRWPGSASPA